MTALKIIFTSEVDASQMHASACYRWNGWSTGSPTECPVYKRLEETLSHAVHTLRQLDGLEPCDLDAVVVSGSPVSRDSS